MMLKFLRIAVLSCAFALLLACSSSNPDDPFEQYNRSVFNFNTALDRDIVKPIAIRYNQYIPSPIRTGVLNFFRNIQNFPTGINDILQGEFQQAAGTTWRFIINSTVGIFGLIDVAQHIGLPEHTNDFGLTLAKWGVKESPYFVLPVFGPGTLRDAMARPVDFWGFSLYPYVKSDLERYGLVGLNAFTRRADLLRYDQAFQQVAFDPYIFQKNAYLQRRAALIAGKQQDDDDFDGDFFEDEWLDEAEEG